MASATYHSGVFYQELSLFLLSSVRLLSSTKLEIPNSGWSQPKPPMLEVPWKSTHLLPEFVQSVKLSSTVLKPLHAQDFLSDSVLVSFGITEKCKRHERDLRFLMSAFEKQGATESAIWVLSNLMGLQNLDFDIPLLAAGSLDDDLCALEAQSQMHPINLENDFFVPPMMDKKNLNGGDSYINTREELKDLLSVFSEHYLPKKSSGCNRLAMLVPYFNRMDFARRRSKVSTSSVNLQAITVAPVRSPEKLRLRSSTRKKRGGKATKERDLFRKNYFHTCESLLALLLGRNHSGKIAVMSLKKSGSKLPELLAQFSVGIAGTGVAVIFSVLCKTAGGRMPFCATKFFHTGFGLGLVWLSWSVNGLRDAVINMTKNPSRARLNEDKMMKRVNRSLNEILFRAVTLIALAVLRFA